MRFDYFEPSSVEEARQLLREGKGHYRVLAGGTDIILQLRRRVRSYRALVNVKRLPGLRGWSLTPDGTLRIGAAAPMRELETSQAVQARFPPLVEAWRLIGSLQLRNLATVGGNLCNASPAADSAPPLIALGATVTFVNDGAEPQTMPVEQFFAGPGRSVLGPDGLLLSVDVRAPAGAAGGSFQRFTPRDAMDISIASAASWVALDPRSGRIEDVRIALGAVAPTPVRAPQAEEVVRGHAPTPELLARAGEVARGECRPIDDIRGTAEYRQALVPILVRRTLEQAIQRAQRQPAR